MGSEVTTKRLQAAVAKRKWLYVTEAAPYGLMSTEARTKSEARANFKRMLGVHPKGRLPADSKVVVNEPK